jgi:hypothetical protein
MESFYVIRKETKNDDIVYKIIDKLDLHKEFIKVFFYQANTVLVNVNFFNEYVTKANKKKLDNLIDNENESLSEIYIKLRDICNSIYRMTKLFMENYEEKQNTTIVFSKKNNIESKEYFEFKFYAPELQEKKITLFKYIQKKIRNVYDILDQNKEIDKILKNTNISKKDKEYYVKNLIRLASDFSFQKQEFYNYIKPQTVKEDNIIYNHILDMFLPKKKSFNKFPANPLDEDDLDKIDALPDTSDSDDEMDDDSSSDDMHIDGKVDKQLLDILANMSIKY